MAFKLVPCYASWLCMVINIRVQYNGGLLLDIILLTQCYYHRGTCLNTMVEALSSQPMKQYVINTMLDVVLHCFCLVFAFCLVSLHGD